MHKYRFIIVFIVLLGDIGSGISQITYFNKRESFISYSQENHSNSLIATDSGYLVAGISTGSNYGYDRINVAFFDLNGNRVRNESFFGNTGYIFNLGYTGSFINTIDDCLLLCGFRRDTGFNIKDEGVLFKLKNNLELIWYKTYPDTNTSLIIHNYINQVKQAFDTTILLVGTNISTGQGSDIILIKTDSLGNKLWDRQYGLPDNNYEYGYSVLELYDQIYMGCFHNIGNISESGNPLVYKTNSSGDKIWKKNFGGNLQDGWALLAKSHDNNILVGTDIADSMLTPYMSYSRICIKKIDTAGNIIWNNKYGPSVIANNLTSIFCDIDGSIISCGMSYIYSLGGNIGWILKTDSNGDSLWMRYYHKLEYYSSFNNINDIQKDYYNGFITCGDLVPLSPDTGNRDIWLLKVDSVGCDTPGCNTGVLLPPLYKKDRPLCSVIPNPVTGISKIEYPATPNTEAFLIIYDSKGKCVWSNKQMSGEEIQIRHENYRKGIYFLKIHEKNNCFSCKFIVL